MRRSPPHPAQALPGRRVARRRRCPRQRGLTGHPTPTSPGSQPPTVRPSLHRSRRPPSGPACLIRRLRSPVALRRCRHPQPLSSPTNSAMSPTPPRGPLRRTGRARRAGRRFPLSPPCTPSQPTREATCSAVQPRQGRPCRPGCRSTVARAPPCRRRRSQGRHRPQCTLSGCLLAATWPRRQRLPAHLVRGQRSLLHAATGHR